MTVSLSVLAGIVLAAVALGLVVGILLGGRVAYHLAVRDLTDHFEGLGLQRTSASLAARVALRRRVK